MANYNPLAAFMLGLMDKFIDDYIATCRENNYPVTGAGFQDVLDHASHNGTPSKLCVLINARFQQRIDNNQI